MLLAPTALLLALLPRGGGELTQALWSSVVTLEMGEVRRGRQLTDGTRLTGVSSLTPGWRAEHSGRRATARLPRRGAVL